MNWLPVNQKFEQCVTSALFKFVQNKCPACMNELGRRIMTEFVALRPKTYYYLMDDGNSDKKAKGPKNL